MDGKQLYSRDTNIQKILTFISEKNGVIKDETSEKNEVIEGETLEENEVIEEVPSENNRATKGEVTKKWSFIKKLFNK